MKKERPMNQFDLKRQQLLDSGVLMMDPSAVWVEEDVVIGEGTLLLPGTILRGKTVIGKNCEIGPNTMLVDCIVGDEVTINSSQCNESEIHDRCEVGPFAHLRPHSVLEQGSKIGAFVQLKNCNLGEGTKMSHLTYVGDADVGAGVNFGCGTITSNYDGFKKHRTTIGDGAFIGCNTNLIAPVTVGDGSYIAAGSTITNEVPADALGIARERQKNLEGWAARKRKMNGKE
jgi:bifunctional UDP-N-acetylglucosamine pyrophosphorylase/glucosamine-1-phosphate N-acetyltransferase